VSAKAASSRAVPRPVLPRCPKRLRATALLLLVALSSGCAEPLQNGGVDVVGDIADRLEDLCRFRRGALADELCGAEGRGAQDELGSLEIDLPGPVGVLPRDLRIELTPDDGGEPLVLEVDGETLHDLRRQPAPPPLVADLPAGRYVLTPIADGQRGPDTAPVAITAGQTSRIAVFLGGGAGPDPEVSPVRGQPGTLDSEASLLTVSGREP